MFKTDNYSENWNNPNQELYNFLTKDMVVKNQLHNMYGKNETGSSLYDGLNVSRVKEEFLKPCGEIVEVLLEFYSD